MVNLSSVSEGEVEGCLISHQGEESFEIAYSKAKERLETATNLTVTKEDALWMLEEVSQFELGRFVLQNGGFNGYWTSYFILYSLQNEFNNKFEKWLMKSAPVGIATRERFWIFQKEIEKRMRTGVEMVSIPCGMMDDLLLAERGDAEGVKLVGIDLDDESLVMAERNARERGIEGEFEFLKKDAWNLGISEEYDVVVSNGLNMYEPDGERRKELYRNFYKTLKSGGVLITSFFTKPPMLDANSPWRHYNEEDVKKQRACFVDVLHVKWSVMQTEEEMRGDLEEVGFRVVQFIYDSQGMMPTVVAEKIE